MDKLTPPPIRLMVDRSTFKLRVYKLIDGRYKRAQTYSIAIGAIGYATPIGPYYIVGRSRTPDWKAPDWAHPDIAGKIFKFDDPKNPFDGGFIALGGHPFSRGDGIGFHGTKFDPQLGTRASHGCIRMAVPDLLDFWDRVPDGTLVDIVE